MRALAQRARRAGELDFFSTIIVDFYLTNISITKFLHNIAKGRIPRGGAESAPLQPTEPPQNPSLDRVKIYIYNNNQDFQKWRELLKVECPEIKLNK